MNIVAKICMRLRTASAYQYNSNIRQLFTPSAIGLEDYEITRSKFANAEETAGKTFRKKMNEYVEGNSSGVNSMIFSEDLKQILHIAKPTDEDISLVRKMLLRFQTQTSHLRFGSYIYGPVTMRLYHYLNKPEEAYKIYKMSELSGVFDQLSSHIVLMDLLFSSGMYEEVIEVYRILRDKQLIFGRHPRNIMVIVFAAYYKLNTPEALNEVLKLWKEMEDSGHAPLRRTVCFAAALALNQNNPHASLELIYTQDKQHFILLRCIKALALAATGKVQDALPILKNVLEMDRPDFPKHTFPSDVVSIRAHPSVYFMDRNSWDYSLIAQIERIKECVDNINSKELSYEFNRIEKQLKEQNHIIDKTFDECMCSEINVVSPMNKTQSIINASFAATEKENKKQFRAFRRPGLADMV